MAILRLGAPFTPRFLEADVHAGILEYNATEKYRQAKIYSSVPTIVEMTLDRPTAVPEVFAGAVAVLACYVSTAEVNVLFGDVGPEGKLPFDLPRDMVAVNASMENAPFDAQASLFKFGFGLTFATQCSGLSGKIGRMRLDCFRSAAV
ncbi:beta-glucosidase [Phyllosticta citriasiana]|uniref:beta-glucosidase n=1 Tax=Phyllosticta citriasiana TaxID=595635 RepID=UPI0030FDA9B9